MWLHIIGDDPKFVAWIKKLHEQVAPGENVYAIRVERNGEDPSDGDYCIRSADDFRDLVQSRSDWDGIIFNPIMTSEIGYLKYIPRKVPVLNSIWGFEFYRSHWALYSKHQFLPETQKVVRSMDNRPRWRRAGKFIKSTVCLYAVCRRMDICYGPIAEEFELFQSLRIFPKKTVGMYGVIGLPEQADAPFINEDSRNILLGNSSTPTNNHIEAIDRLAELDLKDRKVIVPLNYGDLKYREIVLRYGQDKLGDRFKPLIDFIPFAEYCRLISSCDVVIMNHLRQQALGNIFLALESGAKVFLNPTSVFHCLKRFGMHVERFDEINSDSLHTRLTSEKMSSNRIICQDKFGEESRIRAMQDILSRCRSLKQDFKNI